MADLRWLTDDEIKIYVDLFRSDLKFWDAFLALETAIETDPPDNDFDISKYVDGELLYDPVGMVISYLDEHKINYDDWSAGDLTDGLRRAARIELGYKV